MIQEADPYRSSRAPCPHPVERQLPLPLGEEGEIVGICADCGTLLDGIPEGPRPVTEDPEDDVPLAKWKLACLSLQVDSRWDLWFRGPHPVASADRDLLRWVRRMQIAFLQRRLARGYSWQATWDLIFCARLEALGSHPERGDAWLAALALDLERRTQDLVHRPSRGGDPGDF